MKKTTTLRLALTLLISCFLAPLMAQISEGGMPPSFDFGGLRTSTSYYETPIDFDVYELLAEDEENAGEGMPLRCAYVIPAYLNMEDNGDWTLLPDGTYIWQLEIYAPGAIAVMLTYEKFIIPEGGKLFLYNPDHSKVLGAYSSKTNTMGKEFATEFVYGDRIILEYVASGYDAEKPELLIDGVHYGYNNIWVPLEDGGWAKDVTLQPCHLNVNCPEGDDWQDQKKGVARILCGGYLCSGSMVHNTAQDFDPLFLSAFHCYEGRTTAQINQSLYYFHYESISCSSNSLGPNSKTITGAQYLVKIPWTGGSDGALLRLNSSIPESYDVYFNGWDRRDIGGTTGVSIHHPDGAIKKISTYLDPLTSMTYHTCATNAHWRVYWSATESGHSSTEGGSSGSPIFSQDKLIVGTLSGGQASCYNHNGLDAYGKIWYHWDRHATQKMDQYLDPINSGVEKLGGAYIGQSDPIADFSWEPQEVILNKPVQFTCQSTGALTREWTFQNGTPATSTAQNPEVVFSTKGDCTVTLSINKGTDDEDVKTVTINVTEDVYPFADFTMNGSDTDRIEIYQGHTVRFESHSEGTNITHKWTFEEGTPATSTQSDVTVTYLKPGTFSATLEVESYLGTDTEEKEVSVTAQIPGASFTSSSAYSKKYPDGGELLPYEGGSVTFIDTSDNFPIEWNWEIEGATPSTATTSQVEVTYPAGKASYPVKLIVHNDSGMSVEIKEDYIQTGGMSEVWNIPQGNSGEEIFRLSGNNFLTGSNGYYSTIAEKFESTKPGTIDQVDLYLKVMGGDISSNYYSVQVYSEKDGLPDQSLYSRTFIGTSVNPDGYTRISFDKAVEVNGAFFIVLGGLASSTDFLAVGAAKTSRPTVYIRSNNQWQSLYSYYNSEWSVSMNVVPRLTYKFPQEAIIAPTHVTANFVWDELYTQLDWTLDNDFEAMARYKIYRDGKLIAADVAGTSYQDSGFTDLQYNCYTVVAEFEKGLESPHSEEACVFVNTPIEEIAGQNIAIYPNPATNELNIESPEAIELLSIQDLQGRDVLQIKPANQNKVTMPVSQLTPGVYLVKIQTAGGTIISKLIKK